AQTQSNGHDGQVPGGEGLPGDELNAGNHNGGEHHHRSAAQYRLGHHGDQCTQLGNEAAQHQEHGAGSQGEAVDHLGHGHKAHVLGEGGVGQHPEQGGKGGAQAVTHDAAGKLLVGGFPVKAAHHYAGDVAHRFHGGDDEHDHHRG